MRSFIFLLVLAGAIYAAHSLCNTCTSMGFACVDNYSFKICSEGTPMPPASPCPNGTVCSTTSQICTPLKPDTVLECSSCGVCNEANTFACSRYNTFRLCLGTPDAVTEEYSCPEGLVCSIESAAICVNPDDGIGNSCPWNTRVTTTEAPSSTSSSSSTTTTTTTTTISPIDSPKSFCALNGRGRYEILTDSTCSEYINCYQSNNVWYGNIYVCPAGRYFNATTQVCGTAVPKRCSASTTPSPTTTEPNE